jgi:hypothetical protein
MKDCAPSVERDGHPVAGSRIKVRSKLGQDPLDVLEGNVRAYGVIEQAVQNFAVMVVHSVVSLEADLAHHDRSACLDL